jgi:hypothetical protein
MTIAVEGKAIDFGDLTSESEFTGVFLFYSWIIWRWEPGHNKCN